MSIRGQRCTLSARRRAWETWLPAAWAQLGSKTSAPHGVASLDASGQALTDLVKDAEAASAAAEAAGPGQGRALNPGQPALPGEGARMPAA
jgi:hypothetical protein